MITVSENSTHFVSPQFTLPNNHTVYGTLIEFVSAPTICGGIAASLSSGQQVQLVCIFRIAWCLSDAISLTRSRVLAMPYVLCSVLTYHSTIGAQAIFSVILHLHLKILTKQMTKRLYQMYTVS